MPLFHVKYDCDAGYGPSVHIDCNLQAESEADAFKRACGAYPEASRLYRWRINGNQVTTQKECWDFKEAEEKRYAEYLRRYEPTPLSALADLSKKGNI